MYKLAFYLTTIIALAAFNCPLAYAKSVTWEIEGGSSELTSNIQAHLESLNFPDSSYAQRWPNQIKNAVSRAGKALGFYHIQSNVVIRDADTIEIMMIPGDPVNWRTSQISLKGDGKHERRLKRLVRNHPFVTGTPINQGAYDTYKKTLLSEALSLGYRDAQYSVHSLSISLETLSANVNLMLKTGPVYHVGKIAFEGSELSSELLQQLSIVKPGTRYRDTYITTLYGQLLDTGYFEQINITPKKVDHQQIDLHIYLKDSAEHIITSGIGYSTDTGPRVRLGWSTPIVNETGHQFNSEIRISEIEKKFTGEYRIPLTNPLHDYLTIEAGWKTKDIEDTNLRIWESSLSKHFISESGWQSVYSIGLEDERYDQGSQDNEHVFYAIPSVAWSYTELDGETRSPTGGHKIWLSIDGSTIALGSETDFIRAITGVKYFKLFKDKHELHTRLEYGTIDASTFEDIPASRRFFTGGDQSVRGFAYESLAPKDKNGELLGGSRLNVASIEYRWRWLPKWHLGIFTDIGRAYNESSEPFRQGAGFGLHWQSMIAPIRFDIAKPIGDDEQDRIRLHLTMGFNL